MLRIVDLFIFEIHRLVEDVYDSYLKCGLYAIINVKKMIHIYDKISY